MNEPDNRKVERPEQTAALLQARGAAKRQARRAMFLYRLEVARMSWRYYARLAFAWAFFGTFFVFVIAVAIRMIVTALIDAGVLK